MRRRQHDRDYYLGNCSSGVRSPTDQRWPNGSVKPPWRCGPHGASCSVTGSTSVAPACAARSMKSSGASTKTSIRVVVKPTSLGLGSWVLPGTASWRKNGAPSRWSPANAVKIPQLAGAKRLRVPADRGGSVGHDQHHREGWARSRVAHSHSLCHRFRRPPVRTWPASGWAGSAATLHGERRAVRLPLAAVESTTWTALESSSCPIA